MIKKAIFILIFITCTLNAKQDECLALFEQKKSQLDAKLAEIENAQKTSEALKAANEDLHVKRMQKLQEEIEKNETILKKIQELKEENEKLLSTIKGLKQNSLSKTYNKMRDSSVADILETMNLSEAANILFSLPVKKVARILSYMNPHVASKLSLLLQKGPPFEKKLEKNN